MFTVSSRSPEFPPITLVSESTGGLMRKCGVVCMGREAEKGLETGTMNKEKMTCIRSKSSSI